MYLLRAQLPKMASATMSMVAHSTASTRSLTAVASRSPIRMPPQTSFPCRRLLTTTRAASNDNTGLAEFKKTEESIDFRPFEEVHEELAQVESADRTSSAPDDSFARVWYHRESEFAVNEQINVEYNMSYVYHAMSSYFQRDNVSLPGIARYFRNQSLEERSHAQMLMDFQARRGGRTKLAHIGMPESDYYHPEKGDALHAMEIALSLEKLNFQKLRDLHDVAEKHNDAQFSDFVETMLEEQADGVKEVADYVAQLQRVGKGLGVFQFDQALQERGKAQATALLAPEI